MKCDISANIDESMIEGTTAMDLAELELARAESLERAKKKLRLNMIWVRLLNEVRAKNAKKAELGESYSSLLINMRRIEQEAISEGIELSQTSRGLFPAEGEVSCSQLGEAYDKIVQDMHSIEDEAIQEGIRLSAIVENGGETNGDGVKNEANSTEHLNGERAETSLHQSDSANSANGADSSKSIDNDDRPSPLSNTCGEDDSGESPERAGADEENSENSRISPSDGDVEGVHAVSPIETQEGKDGSSNGKAAGTCPERAGENENISSEEDTDKTSSVASDLEEKGPNSND